MIEVKNLTKSFGKVRAIKDVSFYVNKGDIVGLLGPNGAGKTTTLRILSGYISADGGEASIGGVDIFSDSFEARRRVGYLPESVPLYGDMRVCEYLRFRGKLKGLRGGWLRERMDAVLEQCQLNEHASNIISNLSKGFRQRVGLADCLLHEPEYLILDEPTGGLDPNQIRNIRELIRELSGDYTVLISTHILSEVEVLCERVLIMDRGTIVASDTPAALVGMMKGNERVAVDVEASEKEVAALFSALPFVDADSVTCVEVDGWSRVECQCSGGVDSRVAIFEAVSAKKWRLRELSVERRKLEDVYAAITHGELAVESDQEDAEALDSEETTAEGGNDA
jgi:ABC-2 type transport system ATP-binding protein